ncbi:peptidylprolyl isomerase, partial [Paenarthrobacter sp. RAF9]
MRRLLAILLPALLLMTACGGGTTPASEPTSQSTGDLSKLDSLKVTDNGEKKTPGVEFAKPLTVAEPTVKLVSAGTGDAVKAGQTVQLAYVVMDGNDGSSLEDTYASDPEKLDINDQLKSS